MSLIVEDFLKIGWFLNDKNAISIQATAPRRFGFNDWILFCIKSQQIRLVLMKKYNFIKKIWSQLEADHNSFSFLEKSKDIDNISSLMPPQYVLLNARSSLFTNFNHCVISSVWYLESPLKLKSGLRILLTLSLRRE
jgi:hypothetical protein